MREVGWAHTVWKNREEQRRLNGIQVGPVGQGKAECGEKGTFCKGHEVGTLVMIWSVDIRFVKYH